MRKECSFMSLTSSIENYQRKRFLLMGQNWVLCIPVSLQTLDTITKKDIRIYESRNKKVKLEILLLSMGYKLFIKVHQKSGEYPQIGGSSPDFSINKVYLFRPAIFALHVLLA